MQNVWTEKAHRLLGPGSSVVVFTGRVVVGKIDDDSVVTDSPSVVVAGIPSVVDCVVTDAILVVDSTTTPDVVVAD